MTLLKTAQGKFSLQSFNLTINNKNHTIALTILSTIKKEYIHFQAPLTDTAKTEFLKHFFAFMSNHAEKDPKVINITEPLTLSERMGFTKGFALTIHIPTYVNSLRTTESTPVEGTMLRFDTGKANNDILIRHYYHLASDNFSISTTLEGKTLTLGINGNTGHTPHVEVELTKPIRGKKAIADYATLLEQTLITLSEQNGFIDFLKAVQLTPPPFKETVDFQIGVTKNV